MKKILKSISTYIVVALVSIGATYGMYSYMDSRKDSNSTNFNNHGSAFKQENVHLASLTTDGYPDFTKAAERSIHAVVHIKSTVKGTPQSRRQVNPFEYFFGYGDGGGEYQYEPQPRVGFGSGVIISNDGYIITNNHVIDKATEIEVTLNDNRKFNAKLIGTDPQTDIALLKVESSDLPYISFGNSDDLKVGEWVLAVGNPFNLTSTVTAGIVSAKSRGNIGIGGNTSDIQSFIQTDAAINQGNSGGALVNTNGELIGINSAIYSRTGEFSGYGFAVPISIAGKVVADIKEYGTVQRAVLGIMYRDIPMPKELEPEKTKDLKVNEGAYIVEFPEISPAKQAGLEVGDVITAINGVKIGNGGELQEKVSRFSPGDKVKVTVKRGNTDKTFEVTLKNNAGETSIVKKTDVISNLGVVFKELTNEQKKQHGISTGVFVAGVESGGIFAKSGLSKGFIILKMNGQNVSTPEEAEAIIQSAGRSADKSLFLSTLTPSGQRKPFAIELE